MRGYEIVAPKNMGLKVKCEVCGAIVPKGETIYYKRRDIRYCNNCKNINLETKIKLATKTKQRG